MIDGQISRFVALLKLLRKFVIPETFPAGVRLVGN